MNTPDDGMPFDTAAEPRPASKKWIHIASPKPGAPLRGLITGVSVTGVLTHWVDGRTVPHRRNPAQCAGCIMSIGTRWRGYLDLWLPEAERYIVSEITQNCVDYCKALSPKSGVNLRGRMIVLRRNGKSANSPVAAELSALPVPADQVPDEIDVVAALCHIWGIDVSALRGTEPADSLPREGKAS